MPAQLFFPISFVLLFFAAKKIIDLASSLSVTLRLSPLIIGTLVLGFATNLPEVFIAVASVIQGTPQLSIGNIIGANINNIWLNLGFSFLFFRVYIGRHKTQINSFLLLFLTALFVFIQFFVKDSRNETFVFFILFLPLFLFLELFLALRGREEEDRVFLKTTAKKIPARKILSKLFIFAFLLFVASELLVYSTKETARLFPLDLELLGMTLVALGTTLPEMATSLAAGLKRETRLLVGNILGSNLLNLFLVGGVAAFFQKEVGAKHSTALFFLFVSAFTLFVTARLFRGKRAPSWTGLVFLVFYFIYLKSVI